MIVKKYPIRSFIELTSEQKKIQFEETPIYGDKRLIFTDTDLNLKEK